MSTKIFKVGFMLMSDFPIHQSARDLSVLETPFCHVHITNVRTYTCGCTDMYIMYAQLLQPTLANVTGHEICISSQLAII